ncbi:hypothetical protein RRG08_033070 [Elysia crispata]|uniref:Uncharacterized protein n=1 Tax=Elysia crispata TaxID=231223 RepID=A0AAE1DTJ9_9GAST|nr:hypothetical protein RRG08_033070 [Elysia crispata]
MDFPLHPLRSGYKLYGQYGLPTPPTQIWIQALRTLWTSHSTHSDLDTGFMDIMDFPLHPLRSGYRLYGHYGLPTPPTQIWESVTPSWAWFDSELYTYTFSD